MPALTGAARSLGIWQEIDTVFSCVFPASREPDPDLVRDVRILMPDFVPIHMRKVYCTPGGNEEYLDFVCAGRWARVEDDPDRKPLRLERPYDFPFTGGVIYHQRTLGTRGFGVSVPQVWKSRGIEDLPLPFDRKMTAWIKAAYHWFMNQSAKEAQKDAMQQIADEEKARDKVLDDLDAEKSYEFCDKLASPGMAKDVEWARSTGQAVNA